VIIVLFVIVVSFRLIQTAKRLKNIMNVRATPIAPLLENINEIEIGIDDEIVSKVIKDLDQWENELGFLNTGISQNSLAIQLDTNSSYLSKIINTYKKQNFSNYLKDLRITYTINYLKDNPDFINNKSTIQVAEQFGFNSIDVFVRALKKKAGITPAIFFKKLKQSNL